MATAAAKRPISSYNPFSKQTKSASSTDMATTAVISPTPEPTSESKKAAEVETARVENKVAKLEQTIKKLQAKLMSRKKKESAVVKEAAPVEDVKEAAATAPAETAPVPAGAENDKVATADTAAPNAAPADASIASSSSEDAAVSKDKPSVVAKLTGKFKRSRPATPQISSVDVSQPAVEEGSSQAATTSALVPSTTAPQVTAEPLPKRRKLDFDSLLPGSLRKVKKNANEGDSCCKEPPAPATNDAPTDTAATTAPATVSTDTPATTETPAHKPKAKKTIFHMLAKKDNSEPSASTAAPEPCCVPSTEAATAEAAPATEALQSEKKGGFLDKLRRKSEEVDKDAHELDRLIRTNLVQPTPKIKLGLTAEPILPESTTKASLLKRNRARLSKKKISNSQTKTSPIPCEQAAAGELSTTPKPGDTVADGTLPIPSPNSAPEAEKTSFFARLPKLPLRRSSSIPEATAEKKVKEETAEGAVTEATASEAEPVAATTSADAALAAPTPKRTSSFRGLLNNLSRRSSSAGPAEATPEPAATATPVPAPKPASDATETLKSEEPAEASQEGQHEATSRRKSLLDMLPIPHKKSTPPPAAWELKLQPETTPEATTNPTTDVAPATDAAAETAEEKPKLVKRNSFSAAATKFTDAILKKKKSTEAVMAVPEGTTKASNTEPEATATETDAAATEAAPAAVETTTMPEPTAETAEAKEGVSKRNSLVLAASKMGDVFRKKKETAADLPEGTEKQAAEPGTVTADAAADVPTTSTTEATEPATAPEESTTPASETPTETPDTARVAKRNSFAAAASKVGDKVTGVLRKKKADDPAEATDSNDDNPTVVVTSPTPVPASAADTVARAMEKSAANPKGSTDEDKQSEIKVTEIGQAV